MKKCIVILALAALLPLPLMADAGLKDAVAELKAEIKAAKASKPAPGTPVLPDPTEIINAIFLRYPVTHIHAAAADIYISDSEIYVIAAKDASADDECWNLAVTADGAFEWQSGKKTGIKIKRDYRQIVDYISYLLDPAGFNSGLYAEYLANPSAFDVLPGKGGAWKEFRLKRPQDGFEAVYVTEKPLWYHGFRAKGPDGKDEDLINSDPEQIQAIPDAVRALPKEIHFEDSPLTLERHLQYL